MPPVKLTIEGAYWSSEIYKGVLYLFCLDGSLRIIDWPKLIAGIRVPQRCTALMECAFLRSDHLYSDHWTPFVRDTETKNLMVDKLRELGAADLAVTVAELARSEIIQIKSPFPYAHNSTLLYKDYMYSVAQSGVYVASVESIQSGHNDADRKWDAPTSGLDATLDVLALAAGDEGLFRLPCETFPDLTSNKLDARLVAKQHCQDCSYVWSSIMMTSHDEGSSVAEFYSPFVYRKEDQNTGSEAFWEAKPNSVHSTADIFAQLGLGSGYCWGIRDRICFAQEGRVAIARYKSMTRKRPSDVELLRSIELQQWKGSPVSADTAAFGIIVELEHALIVVRSDDVIDTIRGEPTNWRVFPNSHHYTNQLHLVFEDRLDVISFNHDYFVDQARKQFGFVPPRTR